MTTTTLVNLYREALRLLRPFAPLAAFSTLMGVASGLGTATLLASLNRAIQAERTELAPLLWTFAGLCALVLAAESVAAVGNSIVGQRVIAELRKQVVERIIVAPIAALQRQGAPRLLATLSHDVDTLSVFTFNLSGFFVSLAITLGCLFFLLGQSPTLFGAVVVALALGIGVNALAGMTWLVHYGHVREAQDELQKGFLAITEGAKELRMHRQRRGHVMRLQLNQPIDRIRDHKISAMRAFWAARAFGGVMFFAVLGVIVAMGAWLDLSRSVISAFALVLLYVKGPIEHVVGDLPALGEARVAFSRVAQLAAALQNAEPQLAAANTNRPALQPGTIELRDASYRFESADGVAPFSLGPIDLAITPGETLFITGENGCGKTTLLMLLLGLYEPTSGELRLDGVPITAAQRDDYRQLFSAVFFDYHLFAELMHPSSTEVDPHDIARGYLARLELSHKVSIVDGPAPAFSTIELSAGQRKRLALVQAYLDDRPVLVFDEWAAEQDPTFRRTFYQEILPNLKAQGRTLIVISHDDRYFDVADRRITLRAGKIVEEHGPARELAAVVSAE